MSDSEMPESSKMASVLQPVPRMRKTPSTFKVMGTGAQLASGGMLSSSSVAHST